MVYELDDWDIKMMAPPRSGHRRVSTRLSYFFNKLFYGHKCEIYTEVPILITDEIRVEFSDNYEKQTKLKFPNKYFIPDLAVICNPDINKDNHVEGAPDIIFEILSNSTRKIDIGIKKDIYKFMGVLEYWIIDPDARWIEIHDLQNNVSELYVVKDGEDEEEDLVTSLKFPDFKILISEFFN